MRIFDELPASKVSLRSLLTKNLLRQMLGGEDMVAEFQFDKNWSLQPIKGDTGQAYMGVNDEAEKIFIKRNSSPFLAALSIEGIAPKLIWTKRTGNGDVLTAQEWLDGYLLDPLEVGQRLDVIQIMQHLHQSESLKNMLYRVGGVEKQAFDFLSAYAQDLPLELKRNHYLTRVFRYLEDHLPDAVEVQACHGDPIHHNWLLSENGRLYLVDWDATMLADPATDLGTILGRYVPFNDWPSWLESYGIKSPDKSVERIYWYSCMDFLQRIKTCYLKQDFKQMTNEILLLKQLYMY